MLVHYTSLRYLKILVTESGEQIRISLYVMYGQIHMVTDGTCPLKVLLN
jgi:hypothetical protein